MASVGQELKKERESRGISLEEMADTTKISLRLLRAVEDDQLDILPGKFFTRGIIRTYAKYIGLDGETVLTQYAQSLQQEERALKEAEHDSKVKTSRIRIKKIFPVVFIIIFLAAVVFTIYITFLKEEKEPPVEQPQAKSPVETLAQTPIQEKAQIPEEEPAQEPTELNLEISFHQETWIQLHSDGERKLYTLFQPGEKFQVTASESLLFTVGNAGGFTFTINGREGRSLGHSGEVVRDINITMENYKDFMQEAETQSDN